MTAWRSPPTTARAASAHRVGNITASPQRLDDEKWIVERHYCQCSGDCVTVDLVLIIFDSAE